MGIFSKKTKPDKIHATKAGRFLADIQREQKQQKDELAKKRQQKSAGGKR